MFNFDLFDGNIFLDVLYQIIGIVAMVISFISFQKRKNLHFLWMQCLACVLFGIQYLMIGAIIPCVFNFLCTTRCIFFALVKNKKANYIFASCIAVILIAVTCISVIYFDEILWLGILCCVATTTSTFVLASKHHFLIRYCQLFIISPIWMVNAIVYVSVGNAISEALNMTSCVLSLLRTRRENKQKEASRQV